MKKIEIVDLNLIFIMVQLKIKKIITADNRLDSEFSVDSVSEDKRYILFR
jgi:hypothetical protein